jgi:hypothetical protein
VCLLLTLARTLSQEQTRMGRIFQSYAAAVSDGFVNSRLSSLVRLQAYGDDGSPTDAFSAEPPDPISDGYFGLDYFHHDHTGMTFTISHGAGY